MLKGITLNTVNKLNSSPKFNIGGHIVEFFSEAVSEFRCFTRKLNVSNNNDESAFASTLW